MERGFKLLTGSGKQRLDKMFTKVIVQEDLPLKVGESDVMHDFLLEVSQDRYKGVSTGTVRVIVTEMSEEGKEQTKIFVIRCVEGGTRLSLSGDLWISDGMTLFAIFGHCINESFELGSCLLGLVSCVTVHHKGDYIKKKTEEVLMTLGIVKVGDDDGLFKKVADNVANIVFRER
jgi:hypothetical protein